MRNFIKVMKALGDQRRVTILKMLQHKPMCVCEIHTALDVSQSTASKHLKILEEAELVTYKKEGLWVNYELADGKSNPYAALMLDNLKHWLEDDPYIKGVVEKLSMIRREDICKRS
ncbi:MAG: transcriptional regulator [Desulfococcus sp. 4484_241]|nr:MAG: transcriptional regulator [Desulfococcus sp. 4484_241]